MEVLKNLKQKRLEMGLSQIKLAQKLGTTALTVQLWERGVGKPNPKNLKKLKKVIQEHELKRIE